MTDHRAQAIAVNDRTYAAWNAHDADAVAAVFAADAIVRENGGTVVSDGRAAIRDRAAMLLAAFPDFHLERLELIIEGSRHADRWVLTGTHRGPLFGIEATGRSVRVEGATFTRMNDEGLVAEDIHFADFAGLIAQLS